MGRMTANEVATSEMTTNVNDNNAPFPKNIPQPNKQPTNGTFGEWGHDRVDKRRCLKGDKSNALINNFTVIATSTMLHIFEIFFTVGCMKEVMMSEMNNELSYPILYWKFLPWLGLWFLMALTHFDLRRDFCTQRPSTCSTEIR